MAWKAKLVRVGDPSLSQSAEVDIEFYDDTTGQTRRFVQSFKVAPGQFTNATAFTKFVQAQTAILVAQDAALAELRALIGREV